jgi:hypothetical protein
LELEALAAKQIFLQVQQLVWRLVAAVEAVELLLL